MCCSPPLVHVCRLPVCVVLHVPAANRHIEAGSPEPDRLPLAGLLTHLIGLTRLTHLHISSKASLLRYSECESP